jgi:hypothetical protein
VFIADDRPISECGYHQELRAELLFIQKAARIEGLELARQILATQRMKDDMGFPLQPEAVIAEGCRAIAAQIEKESKPE